MSFNKRILPKKKELIKYLRKHGSNHFYWRWIKSIDVFIGPCKSIDFIHSFEHKYCNNGRHQEFNQLD